MPDRAGRTTATAPALTPDVLAPITVDPPETRPGRTTRPTGREEVTR